MYVFKGTHHTGGSGGFDQDILAKGVPVLHDRFCTTGTQSYEQRRFRHPQKRGKQQDKQKEAQYNSLWGVGATSLKLWRIVCFYLALYNQHALLQLISWV